ncbi:hypothetical protein [Teredinibacter turnerae]|uniref:hypothetical protein n=1 Tax=Teredinibacter turnerae TaxID=2426 RepID=UPI00048F2C46|nr:hypothetical protein [Teredinibacter turnerae]
MLFELTNREKNLWVTLFVDISAMAMYFFKVGSLDKGLFSSAGDMTSVLISVINYSILVSIVLYGLIAFQSSRQDQPAEEAADERDYQFEAKANRLALYTLHTCIICLVGYLYLGYVSEYFGFQGTWVENITKPLEPIIILHILLVAAFISDCTKALVQLFHYRRGY